MRSSIILYLFEPRGRWICGVIALIMGLVRLFNLPATPVNIMPGQLYAIWFIAVAIGLFLTSNRPWGKWGRVISALSAAPFIALGMDVIGYSITSGAVPMILAYRLAWEALRCQIG